MGVFAQSHTRRRRHHLEIDKVKLLLELDKVKLETDHRSQKKSQNQYWTDNGMQSGILGINILKNWPKCPTRGSAFPLKNPFCRIA